MEQCQHVWTFRGDGREVPSCTVAAGQTRISSRIIFSRDALGTEGGVDCVYINQYKHPFATWFIFLV